MAEKRKRRRTALANDPAYARAKAMAWSNERQVTRRRQRRRRVVVVVEGWVSPIAPAIESDRQRKGADSGDPLPLRTKFGDHLG